MYELYRVGTVLNTPEPRLSYCGSLRTRLPEATKVSPKVPRVRTLARLRA